jgi:hypothetical protein
MIRHVHETYFLEGLDNVMGDGQAVGLRASPEIAEIDNWDLELVIGLS